jgi:uncharacterized protein (TIGR00297 family)
LIIPSVSVVAGGTIIIAILAALSVKVKALDFPGAISGALISFAALLAGGLAWLSIIIAFVLISSVLTRFRYSYKQNLGSAQEKGGRRSWPNALANGLVGGIISLLEIATHQPWLSVAYLASFSAAMSDTIATEIGLLSRSEPRLILDPAKTVTPGTSGGITLIGELAGLVSAVGLCGVGLFLGLLPGQLSKMVLAFVLSVVASFVAMNIDSLLGATVQGRYKCGVCGIPTESLYHHGERTIPEQGISFLDNNGVNLLTTIAAALIAGGIYLALVS